MKIKDASNWRVSRLALGAAALVVTAAIVTACGGGGSAKDKTATTASGTTSAKTATTGTPKSGTPGANGTVASGTPGVAGTAAAGTPGAATSGTPGPNSTPGADGNGTPVPGATPGAPGTTPAPGSSPLPGTGQDGADPVTEADATLAAAADPSISGGDPTKPQETVGNVPDPPAGATIDSKTIATVDVSDPDVQVLIDLDASRPGVQSSRDVKVGDVIRVGVIVLNAPSITALGFDLNYDKAKMVAPTIINGPSTDRNPDLNLASLGGPEAGWVCSPSPIGDRDETDTSGDGDPSTGQAFLGCYTGGAGGDGGSVVMATTEFRVTGKGTAQFSLSGVSVYDRSYSIIARCDGDPGGGDPVPCRTATLNIQ